MNAQLNLCLCSTPESYLPSKRNCQTCHQSYTVAQVSMKCLFLKTALNCSYYPKITSVQRFDFLTLYTSIPHHKLRDRITMHMVVSQTFLYKNGSRRCKYLVVNGDKAFFTSEETSAGKKYGETLICQMIDVLIDNIYIKIGNHLFRQCMGIPMGTSCAPLLANLLLYLYEVEFLRSIKKSNEKFTKAFNLASRYIDDFISHQQPKF